MLLHCWQSLLEPPSAKLTFDLCCCFPPLFVFLAYQILFLGRLKMLDVEWVSVLFPRPFKKAVWRFFEAHHSMWCSKKSKLWPASATALSYCRLGVFPLEDWLPVIKRASLSGRGPWLYKKSRKWSKSDTDRIGSYFGPWLLDRRIENPLRSMLVTQILFGKWEEYTQGVKWGREQVGAAEERWRSGQSCTMCF